MSINFPTSLDTFTNPLSTDTETAVPHATQHANANDAITALETKVGINSSAVNTTHDYKLSGVTTGDKAMSLTGTEVGTNKTFTAPKINIGSDATGDIYYRDGSGNFQRLPIGSAGQILNVSNSSIPAWVSNPSAADAAAGTKGVVDIATQAQADVGTATGSTSAPLVTANSNVRARNINAYVADTGSSTAYAIAPTPAITAYATGQKFTWKATNANTTSTPTLNVNSLGTKTITNPDGTALGVGQIPASAIIETTYDGTNFQLTSVSNKTNFSPNTDINNSYITTQLPFIPTTSALMAGWTVVGTTPFTFNGAASYVRMADSASASALISSLIVGSGSTDNYSPAQNKIIRYKQMIRVSDTTDRKGWGFCVTAANIHTAQTDTTNGEIRFILNGSTLYAQNANGTATSTDVTSGITVTNWNMYEIVFTPGTDIKYYINGNLVATSTTNLPTTGTLLLAIGNNANGRVIDMLAPIISVQS